MVYRGKPSRSCRECRRRDIKCDKKKPDCSQCARAGTSCSGYPDLSQLIVCNETSATIAKARKNCNTVQHASQPDPLSTRFLPSFEDRAKKLFVSQYVLDSDKTNLFAYMQEFHPPKCKDSPLLATAVRAVFLAFFSFSHHSRAALYHARVSYGTALSLTSSVIQSPKEAKKDTTLLSLMLLSVFERLARFGEGDITIQNSHLQGALGLVRYRGDRQFTHRVGVTMFLQLNELVLIDCLANENAVPSELFTLRAWAQQNVDATSVRWEFSEIMLQYAQLKYAIKHDLSHGKLIPWAERLDSKLILLSQQLRPFIPHSRQNLPDQYPDHNARRSWNNIRVIRILIAEAVRESCAICLRTAHTAEDSFLVKTLHESTHRVISLCSEIFSSIPYHEVHRPPTSDESSSIQTSTLFFHLYVARAVPVIPGRLQKVITDRLQLLTRGQFYGLEKLMTEMLSEPSDRPQNIWKIWLKIGKESFLFDC